MPPHGLCWHLRFAGPHVIFMWGRCQLSTSAGFPSTPSDAWQEQRRGWHDFCLMLQRPCCAWRGGLAGVPIFARSQPARGARLCPQHWDGRSTLDVPLAALLSRLSSSSISSWGKPTPRRLVGEGTTPKGWERGVYGIYQCSPGLEKVTDGAWAGAGGQG